MVLGARVQYIFLYNFLLLLILGVFLSYIGRTGRYVPHSYESKRYTVFLLFFIHNINFPSKNFANLTVLPKNVAKVIHLCQIDTFRIAHNSF